MRFSRSGTAVRTELDEIEVHVLSQLGEQLLSLIEPAEVSSDPLAAMVGMPPGEVHAPDDPILSRLLPPAYGKDDAAAAEFRRYTDADLRNGKRAATQVLLATLPTGGGAFDLDRDQVDSWLVALNDMRLALGTSLDVSEDTDLPEDLDAAADDPGAAALAVYAWLGDVQAWLLSCVDPRPAT